jgi:hypothetical protein
MGIETVRQQNLQNHSLRVKEFEREDDTSAGALFTNDLQRDETMTKQNTVANSTHSTYNGRVGTSQTTEEVEKN